MAPSGPMDVEWRPTQPCPPNNPRAMARLGGLRFRDGIVRVPGSGFPWGGWAIGGFAKGLFRVVWPGSAWRGWAAGGLATGSPGPQAWRAMARLGGRQFRDGALPGLRARLGVARLSGRRSRNGLFRVLRPGSPWRGWAAGGLATGSPGPQAWRAMARLGGRQFRDGLFRVLRPDLLWRGWAAGRFATDSSGSSGPACRGAVGRPAVSRGDRPGPQVRPAVARLGDRRSRDGLFRVLGPGFPWRGWAAGGFAKGSSGSSGPARRGATCPSGAGCRPRSRTAPTDRPGRGAGCGSWQRSPRDRPTAFC